MTKTRHIIKTVAKVLLCIGIFTVFNESDSFTPNMVGLGCLALLIVINKDNNQ